MMSKRAQASSNHSSNAANIVSIHLSDRTSVYVSSFNEVIYYHIKDTRKNKSVSLTRQDLKLLLAKRSQLLDAGERIQRTRGEQSKKDFHRKARKVEEQDGRNAENSSSVKSHGTKRRHKHVRSYDTSSSESDDSGASSSAEDKK